ncbi:MAG: ABC transporter permease subunit, partial [Proteobacteria bacterium]|nr:ABC transporter permease subunit [Pseudomonadota bacterium]
MSEDATPPAGADDKPDKKPAEKRKPRKPSARKAPVGKAPAKPARRAPSDVAASTAGDPQAGRSARGDAGATQADRTPEPIALIRVPMPVRWRDLDAFNHVNNSKYLSYLEEARLRFQDLDSADRRAIDGDAFSFSFALEARPPTFEIANQEVALLPEGVPVLGGVGDAALGAVGFDTGGQVEVMVRGGMRNLIIYELEADYANYLEALGAPRRLVRRYAFRNALLPQITGLALQLGVIIGGALVTEVTGARRRLRRRRRTRSGWLARAGRSRHWTSLPWRWSGLPCTPGSQARSYGGCTPASSRRSFPRGPSTSCP